MATCHSYHKLVFLARWKKGSSCCSHAFSLSQITVVAASGCSSCFAYSCSRFFFWRRGFLPLLKLYW